MKKIIFLLLIPQLIFSQKILVAPFFLNAEDKTMCLAITIENTNSNDIYLFQKSFKFHLFRETNGKKILIDNEYFKNEGISQYRLLLERKVESVAMNDLNKHIESLKNESIKQDLKDDKCDIKNSDSEYAILWYNSFLTNILFIPVKQKISLLAYSISTNKYPKGNYQIEVVYDFKENEIFRFETYNLCKKKNNVWWYKPQQYGGFSRSTFIRPQRFSFKIG